MANLLGLIKIMMQKPMRVALEVLAVLFLLFEADESSAPTAR